MRNLEHRTKGERIPQGFQVTGHVSPVTAGTLSYDELTVERDSLPLSPNVTVIV